MLRTKEVVHIDDLRSMPPYREGDPVMVAFVDLAGARTILIAPMIKENELIGTIAIYRQEVRPFTDKQIELVKNFAAQAVIAIENARLLNELRESLQQQTATSEVLRVISASPGELGPVFDAILENATRICEAKFGTLFLREEDAFRVVAMHNTPPALAELRRRHPVLRPGPGTSLSRSTKTKQAVQIADITADQAYFENDPDRVALAELGGYRSVLSVPMLKNNDVIGAINIYRQEPQSFAENQITLITSFANQAVIAIENTRLLNELRESLQQQTATADVLKVISRSTFDLQAVLQTLVQSAAQLCEADVAGIHSLMGFSFRYAASYGMTPDADEFMRNVQFEPGRGTLVGRTALEGRAVQILDIVNDPDYTLSDLVRKLGIRTMLGVPLLREGTPIGVLTLHRTEVRPFTDKQIELVTTFADQAVIAIENVRLLNELRESLQQQTATADVLKVISRSTFDLQTVFDALVDSAARLCEAESAFIYQYGGNVLRMAAGYNVSPGLREFEDRNPLRLARDSGAGRAALERRTIHIADVQADPEYTYGAAWVSPYRTVLAVPMLRDDELLGAVIVFRHEVRPFTDKQTELLTTFADQAAIAIQNVRLFEEVQARTRELSEALEQQTATSEVLRVISSSPGELEPVFQAMLENATRICEADLATMALYEDGGFRQFALRGAPPAYAELRQREPVVHPHPEAPLGRLARTKNVVHVDDLLAQPDHAQGGLAKFAGARTLLIVPLLKEQELVGMIGIYRQEVRPFTDKHIELVQSFGNQAVIAIVRTPDCSMSCVKACSSRPRPPTCSKSSAARRSSCSPSSTHWLRTPSGYARPKERSFFGSTVNFCAPWRPTTCRLSSGSS